MNNLNKTRILLIILFVIPSMVYAQKFEVNTEHSHETSAPYDKVDGKKYYHVVEDGLIAIKIDGVKVTVQKFNAESLMETSKKVYEDLEKGMKYEAIFKTKESSYIFFARFDKKQEKEILVSRQILDNGTLGKKKNLITSERRVPSSNPGIMSWNALGGPIGLGIKYKFQLSHDSSQLFIKYLTKPNSRKQKLDSEVVGLFIFDSNLEKLAGKEMVMPYPISELKLKGFCADKEHNIFMFTHVKGMSDGKKKWLPKIIRIENESEVVDEYDIDILISRMSNLVMYQNQSGFATFVSLTDKKGSGGINSIYRMTINLEGEVINNAFVSFLDYLSNDRGISKNNIKNIDFESIHLNEDGSVLFIGEVKVMKDISNNASKAHYIYMMKDFFLVQLGVDGEIDWARLLPKNQVVHNKFDYFKSNYGFYTINGKYYFTFIDNIKNMDPNLSKTAEHRLGRGGYITTYEIDKKTGDAIKMSFLNIEKTESSTSDEHYNLEEIREYNIIGLNDGTFMFEAKLENENNILVKCKILE